MPAVPSVYTSDAQIHHFPANWCIVTRVGRTNIHLDDELVEKAMQLTGARSKREVVEIALTRLVEKGTLYRSLRRLRGKLAWEGDVDAGRADRTQRP